MVDLKAFISSVLVNIDEGIKEAEQKTKKKHVLDTYYNENEHGDKGIQFDVAITAGSEVAGKAGAEIKVVSIASIGAKADAKISNQEVSRIKFTILRSESDNLNQPQEKIIDERSGFPNVLTKKNLNNSILFLV